jgi:glyoxylase-like metal-dependent hydrolase (beta-lactamase superfamily II)
MEERVQIRAISLPLPYKLGSVNCYLWESHAGYLLIDTGASNRRDELERELARAGCEPGKLVLIVLTHGDFDHAGNCAYLREKFGAQVAMHQDDLGMVEQGDMFWNRKSGNALMRLLLPILFGGFPRSHRFRPDMFLQDGADLSEHGFDAQVILIPGHSKGSIGILTAGGDLFCGDLLENVKEPALNSIMDDLAAARASIDKLRGLEVETVYPGHGKPFPIDLLPESGE